MDITKKAVKNILDKRQRRMRKKCLCGADMILKSVDNHCPRCGIEYKQVITMGENFEQFIEGKAIALGRTKESVRAKLYSLGINAKNYKETMTVINNAMRNIK